jgi:hypothetical protein
LVSSSMIASTSQIGSAKQRRSHSIAYRDFLIVAYSDRMKITNIRFYDGARDKICRLGLADLFS